MEKYPEELVIEIHEIYKLILERIVDTGETQESDLLFIKLYETKFRHLAYKLMVKGE